MDTNHTLRLYSYTFTAWFAVKMYYFVSENRVFDCTKLQLCVYFRIMCQNYFHNVITVI